MELLNQIQDNWSEFLQNLGIIGGLFLTAFALFIDTKVRKVANRFEATKQHREIWTLLYSRPDLQRVLDEHAEIATRPITNEEKLFVNLLLLHLESNYLAAKAGMFMLPEELQADIRAFFACPIPRAVWETLKPFQDAQFTRFVDERRGSKTKKNRPQRFRSRLWN